MGIDASRTLPTPPPLVCGAPIEVATLIDPSERFIFPASAHKTDTDEGGAEEGIRLQLRVEILDVERNRSERIGREVLIHC